MRNTSKISTLEAKFPLLAVEHGCLVSKYADLTIAFKLELPELFTVTESEYEAMHSAWHKAIKVLPNYSIVHKQDWFIQENYAPELNKGELSFLARASERHFNERPYLHHAVYLFLTKTTKKRMAQQSNFSALCRGHLIPKDIEDKDARYERLSTDRSDCRLSFAAPVGLLLSCNHIYNQYLFIEDSDANLERFEKQARNMHSLARYSRSNQINEEWIQEYLNLAHSLGLTSIRAHFNVLAWSSDKEELRQVKNDVGSALALMECKPRHNTIDTATLYWAGIPGNAGDFPAEESFYTFIEPLRQKRTTKILSLPLASAWQIVCRVSPFTWTFLTCR